MVGEVAVAHQRSVGAAALDTFAPVRAVSREGSVRCSRTVAHYWRRPIEGAWYFTVGGQLTVWGRLGWRVGEAPLVVSPRDSALG